MTLYLICHKVRGEAAFDVAQRMPELNEDGEEGWIIPTSGHRAHPYWYCSLEGLLAGELHAEMDDGWFKVKVIDGMPADCPDHYPCNAAPETKGRLVGLIEKLTSRRAPENFKRRV